MARDNDFRPPSFDGTDFSYWKNRMRIFFMGISVAISAHLDREGSFLE